MDTLTETNSTTALESEKSSCLKIRKGQSYPLTNCKPLKDLLNKLEIFSLKVQYISIALLLLLLSLLLLSLLLSLEIYGDINIKEVKDVAFLSQKLCNS